VAPAATVHVVTLRAVAGLRHADPDGRRYPILAFVRAATEADATAAALRGVDQIGWDDVEPLRCGEITEPAALPDDFRDVYEQALRNGCALIVYDEA
jgi:hypothetical protein